MNTFGAIYLDPPWGFDTYSHKGVVPCRTEEQPYPTMTLAQIAALPIPDLAAKDAAVFMWLSDSLPRAVFTLADAWGFRIPTSNVFIWRKPSMGMGYWTRKETECCALLVRGKPSVNDHGVRQVIDAPRREHSRKPDCVYGLIERLVGGPYLEMFARQAWPGWSSWGNETDKFAAGSSVADIFV